VFELRARPAVRRSSYSVSCSNSGGLVRWNSDNLQGRRRGSGKAEGRDPQRVRIWVENWGSVRHCAVEVASPWSYYFGDGESVLNPKP
jgi:hypothetical protein